MNHGIHGKEKMQIFAYGLDVLCFDGLSTNGGGCAVRCELDLTGTKISIRGFRGFFGE